MPSRVRRNAGRESQSFSAVEQLDEAARELGRSIEYRQLGHGRFAANMGSLEGDGVVLASERFNNHLQVHSTPSEGFVGLFLAQLDEGWVKAGGKELGSGDLMVLPSRSDLEVVTQGVVQNETLFMPQAEFIDALRVLAGCDSVLPAGDAEVRHCDPSGLREVARWIRSSHDLDRLDPEAASGILAAIAQLLVNASAVYGRQALDNGVAASVARRAQDYIECEFRGVVRMQDLCGHSGVSMRTLQRCFAAHFQLSPSAYLKARRLNAARRELRAGSSLETTVTDVAMNNGLVHLGRFSADYRQYFGESPSETLRN